MPKRNNVSGTISLAGLVNFICVESYWPHDSNQYFYHMEYAIKGVADP